MEKVKEKIIAFLEKRKMFESQLNEKYANEPTKSRKLLITNAIKQIVYSLYNSPISKQTIINMPQPFETDNISKFHFIKHPVKVTANYCKNQHMLECEFGTGLFSLPKQLIDPKVYTRAQRCHFTAILFAIIYSELKPNLITGTYNRMVDNLINPAEAFLHSVCQFNLDGKSKIFDGSHNLIMDEELYRSLFNFTELSRISNDELLNDFSKIQSIEDFDYDSYLLGKNFSAFEKLEL